MNLLYLVGGLEHDFYLSINSLEYYHRTPTDEVIFFKGVGFNHQPVIRLITQITHRNGDLLFGEFPTIRINMYHNQRVNLLYDYFSSLWGYDSIQNHWHDVWIC